MLAFLVWAFVVSSGEQVRKFPEALEVKTFNLSEGLSVANQAEWGEVNVYLSAQDDIFKGILKEELSAYLDLAGINAAGEYELPINITVKKANVRVVRVNPASLKVNLQATTSKELPVKTETIGKLTNNFRLGELQIDPLSVSVSGAESEVKKAVAAMAKLELTGEEEDNIERQVSLIAVDDLGEELPGIIINPDTVALTAPLTKVIDEKVVTIKADLGNTVPKAGYWLEKVEVTPATISLTGTPQALTQIENLKTTAIDIAGIDSNVERTAQLILPEGVTVATGESNQVLVKVSVTQQESSREVFANVETSNLVPNLEVEKISPASLQVEVKGSFETLKDLETSRVKFMLDLTGKKAGTYQFKIDQSMLKVPYPLQVGEFEEQEIEITIIEK